MLKLARTNAEAHAYMRMTPCEACGERGITPPNTGVTEVDGELVSVYAQTCPRCGTRREFRFRIPRAPTLPDRDRHTFGDEGKSELLDPGQWLWYADRLTAGLPAKPTADLSETRRRQVRLRLLKAAAAVAEAAKFIPDGAPAVPVEALWSPLGQSLYEQQPGRFERERLDQLRRSCQEAAEEFHE